MSTRRNRRAVNKNRRTKYRRVVGGNADRILSKIEALKQLSHSFDLKNRFSSLPSFNKESSLVTSEDIDSWLLDSTKQGQCPLPKYLRQIRKILGVEQSSGVFGFITKNAEEEDALACHTLLSAPIPNVGPTDPKRQEEIVKKFSVDNMEAELRSNYEMVIAHLIKVQNKLKAFPKELSKFFKDYADLSWVKLVSKISSGKNGVTYRAEFSKYGLVGHAVLKRPMNATADNLFYEFMMGKEFINKQALIYPCFINTYDLYYVRQGTMIDNNLQDSLVSFSKKDIGESCEMSSRLALMIEHVGGFPISPFIDNKEKTPIERIIDDTYGFLFQVYFPLFYLGTKFTHYDLHDGNIMLQKPFPDDRFVRMVYHMQDGSTVAFDSEFIIKMIDYGLCFVGEGNLSSTLIGDVCKTRNCGSRCGSDFGYGKIHGRRNDTEIEGKLKRMTEVPPTNDKEKQVLQNLMNWPDSTKSNVTYDLWFLDIINDLLIKKYKLTQYFVNVPKYFGVEVMGGTYTGKSTDSVSNVSDVMAMLHVAMQSEVPKINQKYAANTKWKLGATMHIYSDGTPYTYELA
jgi:hypothetical protein